MTESALVVSVPDDALAEDLANEPGVDLVHWPMGTDAPRDAFDIVVTPYMRSPRVLRRLEGIPVRLVQGQSIGYDGIAQHVPAGTTFANATSVHEASTAELAVTLALAAQRGVAEFAVAQSEGRWAGPREDTPPRPSLADSQVLIVGFGGVGTAIAARLQGFDVSVTAVARTARVEHGITVHAMDDLMQLVPDSDIVILALPGGDTTARLVDDAFLTSMKPDALLVNVGRGTLVDTDALLRHLHTGRIRAALDVVDPEPVPDGHPIWDAPNLLLTPHVGGASTAMRPRIAALVREQIRRMAAGQEPANVVLRT